MSFLLGPQRELTHVLMPLSLSVHMTIEPIEPAETLPNPHSPPQGPADGPRPRGMYEMLRNRSHTKDLANPSCQKLDAHPIHISAQAE